MTEMDLMEKLTREKASYKACPHNSGRLILLSGKDTLVSCPLLDAVRSGVPDKVGEARLKCPHINLTHHGCPFVLQNKVLCQE